MSSYYKAFVDVKGVEYRFVLLNRGSVTNVRDPIINQDVGDELKGHPEIDQHGLSWTIKKVIDCDRNGVTTIFNEYQIVHCGGVYGILERDSGQNRWGYIPPGYVNSAHVNSFFQGDNFKMHGDSKYRSNWFTQNLPAMATIDWDRLEVHCEGETLDLEVLSRN